jgi:hypothetical protein
MHKRSKKGNFNSGEMARKRSGLPHNSESRFLCDAPYPPGSSVARGKWDFDETSVLRISHTVTGPMAEGTVPVLLYRPSAQIDDIEVPVRVLHSGNQSRDETPVRSDTN